MLLCKSSYAEISSVEILSNIEIANAKISAGSEPIDLIAIVNGSGSFTFQWALRGSGELSGNTEEIIQYLPPENIEEESLVTVNLKVIDEKNDQEEAEVKFFIGRPPIEIVFQTLYPFPSEEQISYTVSPDHKEITIQGEHSKAFGLTFENVINSAGRNTLEIEIIDIGQSKFREDESTDGVGDGKMLKVIIQGSKSKEDQTLTCSNWPTDKKGEFVFKQQGTGILEYSLKSINGDSIQKLGFVFFNAKLGGFKIRARLVSK